MSSAVSKDGVLLRVSPSLIDSFNPESPFGCPVRGYLKYRLGWKEPQTGNMELGSAVHSLNEGELLNEVRVPNEAEKQALELFAKGKSYVAALRDRVRGVELQVPGEVAGVKVSEMSKCDVVLEGPPEIVDWKTTSSLEYAKTPGQLRRNDQLIIYARAFHPDAEEVTLTHGYYVTKGRPYFEARSVKITKQQLTDHYDNIIVPAVKDIQRIVALPDTTSLTPNKKACFRCPHKSACPALVSKESESLVSFFTRKTAPAASLLAEGIHANLTREGQTNYHDSSDARLERALTGPAILPPDAPKSDPALAADPVEGYAIVTPKPVTAEEMRRSIDAEVSAGLGVADFEPRGTDKAIFEAAATPPVAVPEVKRGRGRPKGSTNKPKELTPSERESQTQGIIERSRAFANTQKEDLMPSSKHTVEKMTVTYGLTLGLPNYSSVRFDVSLVASVEGDPASVYDALLNDVKAKVSAEIEKVQAQTKGGK